MTKRLVVIGGDAAGMSAAAQVRRRAGDSVEIVGFERGHHTSYAACGIPYFLGGAVADADRLVARTPEAFRASGIDVRTRHEVTEIDLARRAVKVRSLDAGTETWEGFDDLMIATGASPLRPPLPGIDSTGVFGVQTLDDGRAIARAIEEGARRVVVVGAGYIGLEMAEALCLRGLDVTLVERASQPMLTLDPDMGALVADALHHHGVKLHLEEAVVAVEPDRDRHVRAVVTESGTIEADLVVLGLGTRPNSRLAAEAGLRVGASGGITVDPRMQTSAEGVWAGGDCVESFHRVSHRPVAIALGTHANKQGRIAGINIAGGYATFQGVLGTAISRICDLEVGRTGLTEGEARAAGLRHVAVTTEDSTRARYFPGAGMIHTKVVAEQRTGRLLGAQIVGQQGAAKRIDVFATALWNEMRVDDVGDMDLAYAPPFSPVWDPVLTAARRATDAVEAGLRSAGRS